MKVSGIRHGLLIAFLVAVLAGAGLLAGCSSEPTPEEKEAKIAQRVDELLRGKYKSLMDQIEEKNKKVNDTYKLPESNVSMDNVVEFEKYMASLSKNMNEGIKEQERITMKEVLPLEIELHKKVEAELVKEKLVPDTQVGRLEVAVAVIQKKTQIMQERSAAKKK